MKTEVSKFLAGHGGDKLSKLSSIYWPMPNTTQAPVLLHHFKWIWSSTHKCTIAFRITRWQMVASSTWH